MINANQESLNFIDIFGKIKSNKFIILFLGLIGISSGIFYLNSRTLNWKGQFQIALSSKDNERGDLSNSFSNSLALSKFINISNSISLKTEVEILRSPSILLPIFNHVKEQKKLIGKNVENWKYQDWIKNVDIKLAKGTSVLNLIYIDSDRDLILDVLNKISKAYQSYSGRERTLSIASGIKYLESQIKLYKDLSFDSVKEIQDFSKEWKITPPPQFELGGLSNSFNSTNLEEIRLNSTNLISEVDSTIKLLEEKNVVDYPYIIKKSPIIDEEIKIIASQILNIDLDLIDKKTKYKANDIVIRNLEERKTLLLSILEKNVFISLNTLKEYSRNQYSNSIRPEGVEAKYRTLLQEAKNDISTLESLKSQLRILELEEARSQRPWDLITNPTIYKTPIGLSDARIIFYSLIFGTGTGLLISLLIEKKKNLIYNKDEISYILESRFLEDFSLLNRDDWDKSLIFLENGPLKTFSNKDSAILSISEYSNEEINSYKKLFSSQSNTNKYLITSEINDLVNINSLIIILSNSQIKRKFILDIKNKLSLLNIKIIGLIIF